MQLTIEYSDERLPFLDILIIKENNCIKTDIYYKPSDTKQYLLFNSCHPKHTRLNIPYNLARRLCTIVSDKETLDERIKELKKILLERNYPKNVIDTGISKATALNIQELRQIRPKENKQDVIAFVSTYNPRNPEVFNTIFQNFPVLKQDPRMKQVFKKFVLLKVKDNRNH